MKNNIVKFLKKDKVVIRPLELHLKASGEGWSKYGEYKFPDEPLLITRLDMNGTDLMYLQFWAKTTGLMQVVVPINLQVKAIIGKNKTQVMKDYDDYVIGNIAHHLHGKTLIGSDPEIFVEDDKGECIPAFDFLGSKDNPDKTVGTRGGYNMYWDGFQGEFVTQEASCLAYQVDSVQGGLKAMMMKAKAYNKKAKLSSQTVMEIPFKLIQEGKEEHVQFGCMPSFNAYGLKGVNLSGREVTYRSAGGHIHFGIGKKTQEEYITIVKALDAVLGVACVSLFAKYDNPKRRTMYGLAGEYRTPPHGLEYRTLSNAWMFHPMIMNLVFDLARRVVKFGENGFLKFWKGCEKETISVIQTCDVKGAQKILMRNKKIMLQLIKAAYGETIAGGRRAELLFNVFKNGMETVVKDPTDIEGNWNLNGEWATHCESKDKNVTQAIVKIETKKKVA